jgi:hypothetical protein
LFAVLLLSSAAADPVQRQLLQAYYYDSEDLYQTMATLTAIANERGDIVSTTMSQGTQDSQDSPGSKLYNLGQESGTLVPDAYGGPLAFPTKDLSTLTGGYGPTAGAYGGLLESGQLHSAAASPEPLPEVVVEPATTVDDKDSKLLPSAILASASTGISNASTAAAASEKSAGGMNSVAVQVALLALSVAAAMAL